MCHFHLKYVQPWGLPPKKVSGRPRSIFNTQTGYLVPTDPFKTCRACGATYPPEEDHVCPPFKGNGAPKPRRRGTFFAASPLFGTDGADFLWGQALSGLITVLEDKEYMVTLREKMNNIKKVAKFYNYDLLLAKK